MSMVNKAIDSSSGMVNKEITSQDITWDETSFTWDGAGTDTWDAQYPHMTNKTINTA